MPDARYSTDYQGPPRDPEAVVRAALSDPDFVHQIIKSYEDQLRGVPGVPWRQILAEEAAARNARAKRRRSV